MAHLDAVWERRDHFITLDDQVTADINAGGISQQLTKSVSNSRNIGDVIIHTTQKPDGHFIHDELEALAT